MQTIGSCPNCLADLIGRHQRACLTCGQEIPAAVRMIEVPVDEPQQPPPDWNAPTTPEPEIAASPDELLIGPVREMDWEDDDEVEAGASRRWRLFRR